MLVSQNRHHKEASGQLHTVQDYRHATALTGMLSYGNKLLSVHMKLRLLPETKQQQVALTDFPLNELVDLFHVGAARDDTEHSACPLHLLPVF